MDIYNPWSIRNYSANRCTPDCYWTSTGSLALVDEFSSDPEFLKQLERIVGNEIVIADFDRNLSYDDPPTVSKKLSVLAMTGYLKVERLKEGGYGMSLPNKELGFALGKYIAGRSLDNPENHLVRTCYALKNGDCDLFRTEFESAINDIVSFRDFTNENSVHLFLLGIVGFLKREYEVVSDKENGEGYPDILLKSLSDDFPHIVIELKKGKKKDNDDNMYGLCDSALEQILDRNYIYGLEGRVHMYGVSVRSKTVFVRCRKYVKHGDSLEPESTVTSPSGT